MASTSYDDHHNNSIDTTRFQNQVTNRQGALSPQPTNEYQNDTSMDGTSTVAATAAAAGTSTTTAATVTHPILQQQQQQPPPPPINNLPMMTIPPLPTPLPPTLPQNFNNLTAASLLPPQPLPPQSLPSSHFANLTAPLQIGLNQNNHLPYPLNTTQLIPPTAAAVVIPPPPVAATVASLPPNSVTSSTTTTMQLPTIPSQMPVTLQPAQLQLIQTLTPPPTISTPPIVATSNLMCAATSSPQHSSLASPRSSTPTQHLQHAVAAQHSPQLLAPATPPSMMVTTSATPTVATTPPPTTSVALGPPPPLNIHAVQEAKEKLKQEKKEKHATKKLMKELAVCKTVLSEMEVSFLKRR